VWSASRPARLYPRERPGTSCTGGWVGPGAGLNRCGKSRPTGIRSPDLPARSESLYRLSYPGSLCAVYSKAKFNREAISEQVHHNVLGTGTENALPPTGLLLPVQNRAGAKPYCDEPGCTIHVDIWYTVPVLVTTVFLKMSPK
jgi:hypothetical protein